jgi:hypothetical protein
LHYNFGMEKTPKRGAPPKPPELRKAAALPIRLTDSERADCEAAAELDGLKLSAWARKTLTSAAKRRISKA